MTLATLLQKLAKTSSNFEVVSGGLDFYRRGTILTPTQLVDAIKDQLDISVGEDTTECSIDENGVVTLNHRGTGLPAKDVFKPTTKSKADPIEDSLVSKIDSMLTEEPHSVPTDVDSFLVVEVSDGVASLFINKGSKKVPFSRALATTADTKQLYNLLSASRAEIEDAISKIAAKRK